MDDVMAIVMQKLEIPIPEFRRSYRLKLSMAGSDKKMQLTGVDSNGDCYTLFKSLKITGLGGPMVTLPKQRAQKQPYEEMVGATAKAQLKVLCEFFGHYNEPNLEITVPMEALKQH